MAKLRTVLGLMSGTSMDGVDLALLRTDGDTVADVLGSGFTPYTDDVRAKLRGVLGMRREDGEKVVEAEKLVTDAHVKAIKAFQAGSQHKIDLIGFHGQTIFHDPANAYTLQIGDGVRLAKETGIDVVYDLRSADMAAGGQGAPLLPVYHRALVKKSGLEEPVCVLNLGGVANITWIAGDTLIACDTGPANALIDDWMFKHTGKAMDKSGKTALSGVPDLVRVSKWMEQPFFNLPAPKSLDRNAFTGCNVDDLSLADGAATLAAFTVQSVLKAISLMPEQPKGIVVAGGGRHNRAVMQGLSHSVHTFSVDVLGWQGDSLEAEGFAYMAMRSVLGLPISFPTTTGCKAPTTGGKLAKAGT